MALTTLAVAALHEVGYSRRVGSNLWNNFKTSVYSRPKADRLNIKNTFFNVINGGGAVVDELGHEIDKYFGANQ